MHITTFTLFIRKNKNCTYSIAYGVLQHIDDWIKSFCLRADWEGRKEKSLPAAFNLTKCERNARQSPAPRVSRILTASTYIQTLWMESVSSECVLVVRQLMQTQKTLTIIIIIIIGIQDLPRCQRYELYFNYIFFLLLLDSWWPIFYVARCRVALRLPKRYFNIVARALSFRDLFFENHVFVFDWLLMLLLLNWNGI